jgi:hypothetical protein
MAFLGSKKREGSVAVILSEISWMVNHLRLLIIVTFVAVQMLLLSLSEIVTESRSGQPNAIIADYYFWLIGFPKTIMRNSTNILIGHLFQHILEEK